MSNEKKVIKKEEYRILVVDDQEEVIELVVPMLKSEGYEVLGTQSGKEAIEIVRNQQIDIILLDYFMPEITGEQVVKEIRKFNSEVVIVLQTGYAGEKPPLDMLEMLDIQGYHDKTEGMEKLLLWVTSAVKACSLIRENKRIFEEVVLANQTIKAIKENQAVLIEQERLASLGELLGGIAESVTNKLVCIANSAIIEERAVNKYADVISEEIELKQEYYELTKEMLEQIEKIKGYCRSMGEILNAVNKQALLIKSSNDSKRFPLKVIEAEIDIMLEGELVVKNCLLNKDFQVDKDIELNGRVEDLTHVLLNLIKNAIEAYEGKGGQIDFKVTKRDNNIEFSVKDYGKGIPEQVKDKIFKQMVSTKDFKGTGLGLYVSASIIKGRFGGKIWVESEEGQGTTFFVSIPVE
ncbi:MAG: ATP-binding protein [Deltaproteobacteria bacterium]